MEIQEEERRAPSAIVTQVLEWTEEIVVAAVVIIAVFTFCFRVITVDGGSMEPTYHNGDRVLTASLVPQPRQGDVVIVVHALEEPIIKRVIATQGQTVDFDPELQEVTVDGIPVEGSQFGIENGITVVPEYPGQMLDFPQTVPEGCVFVLGDNRMNSKDSRFREIGMIDNRNILGKVIFNLFPFSIFGPAG